MTRTLWFSLAGLFLLTSFALEAAPRPIPALTGPVIDEAKVLDPVEVSHLEKVISNAQPNCQIQIWIIKGLEDEPIENLSIRAVEAWKLGSAKQDNGVLILVSPSDRKMRIEVGQGLEGALPDAIAARVVRDIMGPAFREGAYYRGLFLAVSKISEIARREFNMTAESRPAASGLERILSLLFLPLLFILMMFFNILRVRQRLGAGSIYSARGSGGYGGFGGWGSGRGFGGGGGGWSGGGGGFSGGGSSGSW